MTLPQGRLQHGVATAVGSRWVKEGRAASPGCTRLRRPSAQTLYGTEGLPKRLPETGACLARFLSTQCGRGSSRGVTNTNYDAILLFCAKFQPPPPVTCPKSPSFNSVLSFFWQSVIQLVLHGPCTLAYVLAHNLLRVQLCASWNSRRCGSRVCGIAHPAMPMNFGILERKMKIVPGGVVFLSSHTL